MQEKKNKDYVKKKSQLNSMTILDILLLYSLLYVVNF